MLTIPSVYGDAYHESGSGVAPEGVPAWPESAEDEVPRIIEAGLRANPVSAHANGAGRRGPRK
jgi:hypothetical protein